MYRVLALAHSLTGVKELDHRGDLVEIHRVHWLEKGVAQSFEEAKAKFGGCPVLEEIKGVH